MPHHLIGFSIRLERIRPRVSRRCNRRNTRIAFERGKNAIVVGGTGFYIRALSGGVTLAPQYDEALRGALARETTIHPPEFLHGG